MSKERKRFKADFKAKVALEALKEIKTVNQLAQDYGLHPNQISLWKKELTTRAEEIFGTVKDKEKIKTDELVPKLYQEIGQLKVELDWLKKKVGH
jgi:transposase-like protein